MMNKIFVALAATGTLVGGGLVASMLQVPAVAAPTARSGGSAADAAHPVVLELYQSQGCSSCPPALKVLDELANRPDVLALNFAVTYWDQLGWKDIYAQPAFTARQWEYSRAQGRSNVQTPQLIVNGRAAVLGSVKPQVEQAILANSRGASGPVVTASGGRITIGATASASPSTVWLVDYDPRTVQVPIRSGENGGRTLPHRNIVKRLTPLGNWTGAQASYRAIAPGAGTAQAVIVQSGKGGAIIAASKI